MKKYNKSRKALAIILSVIMVLLTLNVSTVSAYSKQLSDNIQIEDTAQVNIVGGNGNAVEQSTAPTQATAVPETQPITEKQTEPQTEATQPPTQEATEETTVDVNDITLDISQTSISFQSSGEELQYKQDNGEWVPYSGTATIIGTTKFNTITVISGTHNITLNNVNIDVSQRYYQYSAFDIQGTSNVTLTLAENSENSLISGVSKAGLQVQTKDNNVATVNIIGGGTLTATGDDNAAGIGGEIYCAGGNVTISGDAKVTANAGDYAAGIGGGYRGAGGTITIIDNANVTAFGGNIESGRYAIYPSAIGGGGYNPSYETKPESATIAIGANTSVTAVAQGDVFAIDSKDGVINTPNGEDASANILQLSYLTKDIYEKTEITSNNETILSYESTKEYQSIAFTGVEKDTKYTVKVNNIEAYGKLDTTTSEYTQEFKTNKDNNYTTYCEVIAFNNNVEENVELDIANGNIILIEANGIKLYNQIKFSQGFKAYTGELTITGDKDTPTQNTITVQNGTHNVTLDGVNIDATKIIYVAAIDIQGTSNVTLTLAENSENTLKSGNDRAGIQVQTKDNKTATVEIIGSGILTVTGGYYGAGIGGGDGADAGNITISGNATVIVIARYESAGIGSGDDADGGNITISGNANVTATGDNDKPGIGGDMGNITISDNAIVTANADVYGAGIGGDECTITISDNATVTATGGEAGAGIGGGYADDGGIITISGNATVTAIGGDKSDENDTYPSAIGSGGYTPGFNTKPESATIAIGVNATVTAVAQGDVLVIDAKDGVINTPDGENANANILQLDYIENDVYAKTEIISNNETILSYESTSKYQSIAFSGVEKNTTYTVELNDVEVYGKLNGTTNEHTKEFKTNKDSSYTIYEKIILLNDTVKENVELDIANGSIVLMEINDNTKLYRQVSEDGFWTPYTGEFTIVGDQNTPTQNTITVQSGTHNITLNGVNIDVSKISYKCAFDIQGSSNVTLTLAENSENILKSGFDKAGLQVESKDNESATVIITGRGALTATGDGGGTGIGGGDNGDGGIITISGDVKVTAIGSFRGAGIGGGGSADVGTITISANAEVTATGGDYGAGIGSGSGYIGDRGNIIITGNAKVTANGGLNGAGIGSGDNVHSNYDEVNGAGGNIIINENATVTATASSASYSGYISPNAIGSGSYDAVNGKKPESSTIAIGVNATVTAVAQGDVQAIEAKNNEINAPDNENIANILQLNYLEQVEANKETVVFNGTSKEVSFAPDLAYQSIAFSGFDTTKTYNVTIDEILQVGTDKDGKTTHDFTIDSGLNNYTSLTTMAFTDPKININESSLYFRVKNDIKQYGENNKTWINYTGSATIEQDDITNSTENTITVASGEHDIILNGVNIDVLNKDNYGAFDIQGTSNVTLTLAENSENKLQSGRNFAGLQVQTNGEDTASVTIQGSGTLLATGGEGAAGIGGGYYGEGGTITISGNADVTAVAGVTDEGFYIYSSAIGNGTYVKGIMNLDGVTLSIGSNAKVTAVATKGKTIDAINNTILNPTGEEVVKVLEFVCLYEVNNKTELFDEDIKIYEYTSENKYNSIAFAGSLEQDKTYTLKINDIVAQGEKAGQEPTNEFVLDSDFTTYVNVLDVLDTVINNPTLDLIEGDIKIDQQSNGTNMYKIGTRSWQKYSGELTIEQSNNDTSTQNTITAISGTHNITLNGVNIDMSTKDYHYAFDIQGTSNVTLTLAENTENILKSGFGHAGLQVQTIDNVVASVTIQGEGMLSAEAGVYGAGIGGSAFVDGGIITMKENATIIAKGGRDGAGIGGGSNGDGGTITISENADVTAIGGERYNENYIYPSAIGSGSYYYTSTKPNGTTLSIGSKATVIAVAQGTQTPTIDALGKISAPDNETVANILQLNYLEQVEANTKTAVLDGNTSAASFAPEVSYQSIAFSGLEANKNYSVVTNNTVQQGQNGASLTNEFIITSQLTTYTNVQATEENLNLVTYVNKDGDILAEEYVATGGTAPRPVLPQLRTEEYVQDFEDSALENITKDTTLVYKKVPKFVSVSTYAEYVDKLDITVNNKTVDTEVSYGEIVKATFTDERNIIGWKINGHVVSVTNSKSYAFYIVETSIIEPILEGTAIEEVDINVGVASYSTEADNKTKAYYPIVAAGYHDATEVKYGVIRSTVESDVTEENIKEYLADTTQQTNSSIVREYTETNVMNGDGRYNYVAVMPTDTDKTLYVKAWIEVDGVLYVSEFPKQ